MVKWNTEEPVRAGEYLIKVLDIPTQEFHIAIAEVVNDGRLSAFDYQPERQQIAGYIPVEDLLNL